MASTAMFSGNSRQRLMGKERNICLEREVREREEREKERERERERERARRERDLQWFYNIIFKT